MSKDFITIRQELKRLTTQQALIGCSVGVLVGVMKNQGRLVISVLLGAGVFWGATHYFIQRVFSQIPADASQFWHRFYRAELVKWSLVSILLFLIAWTLPLSGLGILIGFLVSQLSILVLPGWRRL